MLYRSYRYSQWDGTQQIFDVDAGDLIDQLSDELLKQGDVMQALREMFRNGMQNREGMQLTGLRELMERLKNQRRQQLEQHNMDSVVDDLKERLEEILRTEREGIDRRLAQAQEQLDQSSGEEKTQQEGLYQMLEQRAQRNLEKLDALPEGLSGQIQGLMEYDFIDPGGSADVPGAAGPAEKPDGAEYFPADAAANSGHVSRRDGGHGRDDAAAEPDDAG